MKLGLKLWSVNTDNYLFEAVKLFEKGIYNFIELYVVPNSIEHLKKWGTVKNNHKIPFTLHAPHFASGINLANKDFFETNMNAYQEIEEYRVGLDAKYTVVHGGVQGNIKETVRQLKLINPQNMLIENKPYKAPLGKKFICRGYNIEEIKYIMDELSCGFCLDIGHAICTANSLKLEPYKFLTEFNKLNPACHHLSDGNINSEIDKHLNFGNGNYNRYYFALSLYFQSCQVYDGQRFHN